MALKSANFDRLGFTLSHRKDKTREIGNSRNRNNHFRTRWGTYDYRISSTYNIGNPGFPWGGVPGHREIAVESHSVYNFKSGDPEIRKIPAGDDAP